jgi:hypothetical protein
MRRGCIPDDQVLIGELCAPTYRFSNVRGRKQLESKDDLKRRGFSSPDRADALALTFAHPVLGEDVEMLDGRPSPRGFAATDFDPVAHIMGG